MTKELTLFLDWRSATHGALRPQVVPRKWASNSDTLVEILSSLRQNLDALLETRNVIVDTHIYGGFTRPDGSDSEEYSALTEALGRSSWAGRRSLSGLRYRDLNVIISVLPDDPGTRLHALFRSRLRVSNPQLRIRGNRCTCEWLAMTEQLFSEPSKNLGLRCPSCGETRVEIESRGQKMVDTLLVTHLTYRASQLSKAPESGEIWVLSDDADVLPAVCTSSAMGVNTVWLRTRPLRKYGYHDIAIAYGIALKEVQSV